ncbi:polysaccharide deacetylase family protein [Maribacter sp. 2308TA10-17]|uniref:polysaccharide deacetylase family protein n=1 Tax=Maribacter sp. 2308TA10-17 TaxID=3386276 RepID=UPI0039BC752D
MKVSFLVVVFFLHHFGANAQNKTIAERLGYDSNAKLLIIHADDLGVSHSENMASIKGLEKTPVNSASIMVPCPWFPEIAKYARENQTADLGLHLTLNSEWIYYKWGPVTAQDSVSTLINENGYFYPQIQDVVQNAKPEHVALELRNQIKKAYKFGIDVTHLDAHMGTAGSTLEFLEAYIKLGKEFELPVLLDKNMAFLKNEKIQVLLDDTVVINDHIFTAGPADYDSGMANYYTKVLQNLEPGLNSILIHLAYDDAEMKAMTVEHDYWHSPWRQADVDFFSSPECATLLKENNITLVTWRELRDKIVRNN